MSNPTESRPIVDSNSTSANAGKYQEDRRDFIRGSGLMIAGGAIAGASAATKAIASSKQSKLRIAMVGCGRRCRQLLDAMASLDDDAIEITALVDNNRGRAQSAFRSIKSRHPERSADHCNLLTSGGSIRQPLLPQQAWQDVDVVFITTPPVCQPGIAVDAITNHKHVFIEKPMAADLNGLKQVVNASAVAKEQGLTVHVGFQRQYDQRDLDLVAQVQQGGIGDIIYAKSYCNSGSLKKHVARSEKEQLAHWNQFNWTGGDVLLEQHVAGLDVLRRVIGRPLLTAQGQAGWASLSDAELANQQNAVQQSGHQQAGELAFQHQSIEFEFADHVSLISHTRRAANSWQRTGEWLYGTQGHADFSNGKLFDRSGNVTWQSAEPSASMVATQAQLRAFFASIRHGDAENQVDQASESTLMALLGQRAAQTSKLARMKSLRGELKLA